MSKELPFDRDKVNQLLRRYKRTGSLQLRNRIVVLALPLVKAAMAKQGMYRLNPELKKEIFQECVLKLTLAIPKFDVDRGDSFGFFWTTICNMSKTVSQRLSRPSLSLSDEETQREAEMNGKNVYQTPENQCILNSVAASLREALGGEGFQIPSQKHHHRATRFLQKAVMSGELFFDKPKVVRRLKQLGLERSDINHYVHYALINVRKNLLMARENATALTYHHPEFRSELQHSE